MSLLEKLGDLLTRKYVLSSYTVIAVSVLFMIVFDNNVFWTSLFPVIDLSSPSMWLFLFACFTFIFSVCFTFFSVFGVGRFLQPLIALVIILAAFTSYYMDAYGTVFDDVMVLNIVETNVHEAMELFDLKLWLHVLLYGLLPVFILYRINIRHKPLLQAVSLRLVTVAAVVSIASATVYVSYKDLAFVFREHREISFFVNPVYPMRAMYRFAEKKIHKNNGQFMTVFNDVIKVSHASTLGAENVNTSTMYASTRDVATTDAANKKHNVLVIVVGETARAQNFHLNGYKRNTTPHLEQHKIINFKNVASCGTATAVSLPCMFSDLTHDNFDDNAARNRQNLLDAVNTAGLQTLWVENNPDCKGVCDRIEKYDVEDIYTDEFCSEGRCYDEALFHGLNDYVNKIQRDTVIVLHTQGSHGPAYYRRYPEAFKVFEPECRTSTVQDCSDAEVMNAYDNTILYTDYFLSKVIDYLATKTAAINPAMLYVSDHGESLGEDGAYLHGLPYFIAPEYQKRVPMVLWLSDGFKINKKLNESCLNEKTDTPLSHDNILHSVMGVMDVSASLYRADLDIFSSCRPAATSVAMR
jgi:lipid A ethanolaminephosphotransferase